jgi:magnesium transporter
MARRKRRGPTLHPVHHPPRRAAPGTPPGSFSADPSAPPPTMQVFAYGPDALEERAVTDLAELEALRGRHPVLWLNIDGVGHGPTVREIGRIFGLHPLALEDVVHTHQRSKVEDYGDHHFIVVRMAELKQGELVTEQVSIFLGEDFVLTFQEDPGDGLDPLRERIRGARGRIRRSGADYLAYVLIDTVVDNYFPILDIYGERLETLEGDLLRAPRHDAALLLHDLRGELLALRRAAWPLREALHKLQHGETTPFRSDTMPYVRDAADHAVRILELIETYREFGAGLLEIHLSSMNNRMSEVMKVLTLIGAIFIPLNFLAALYGMNFNTAASPLNMPELNWYWGYPLALFLMALVVAAMLAFFHRKGWLVDLIRLPERERDE